MPIYEYECRRCRQRLETMQRMGDPPLTQCPECGGELRKLVSAPAFHLKGSGWYVTDYAKKGGDAAGKGAADEGGETKAAGGGMNEAGEAKTGDAKTGGAKTGDGKAGAAAKDAASTSSSGSSGGKASAGGPAA